jgi:cob(I)alamin adenosyltransferase
MAIYTKKGDRGTTSLYGENVARRKSDQRIVAYGTVDELNSQLGLVLGFLTGRNRKLDGHITSIQQDLFEIASTLASPNTTLPFTIEMDRVRRLEKLVDELEGTLPALANFIFPGGSRTASLLHVARSVCRRAEREIVALSEKEDVDDVILIYINRLSDLLFMLARWANHLEGKKEKVWKGK